MKRIYKEYIDNVEVYYPYATEFADYSIAFFKAKYRTNQKPFKPRIKGGERPPLEDILVKDLRSKGLKSIFRNLQIDKSKYKLLTEEVAENTECNDWYEVTETYGYADMSSNYYVKYSTASVNFIGSAVRNKLWGETQYDASGKYLSGFSIIDYSWVSVPTGTQPIYPGDRFVIRRKNATFQNGATITTFYALSTDEITAQEKNKLPIPIFRILDQDTSASASVVFQNQPVSTQNIRAGKLTLTLVERLSPSKSDTVVVETRTQFFESKPSIIYRTKWVNVAGAEVDIEQDGEGFDPEAGLYDGKYCVEDSAISQDLTTGLWRRDIKLTDWKVL